jgi:hypothetical protein
MIRNVEMMYLVCHVTCDVDVETMQPDSPKKQQKKSNSGDMVVTSPFPVMCVVDSRISELRCKLMPQKA